MTTTSDARKRRGEGGSGGVTVAEVLAQHREEWASYIENWSGAVGPQPPTVESIVRALRLPSPPFGVAQATTAETS